jgi:2-amino-4-hydroxy-6-hydroxymethyldihydropteridine diphosphokinase
MDTNPKTLVLKMDEGIFLGFGSNLGDREGALQTALDQLRSEGIAVLRRSAVYQTPPWGNEAQPPFLNMVAEVDFVGSPSELLQTIMEVEEAMGRLRTIHWGPRLIDIDLLAFGDHILRSQRLTVPHPFLAERAFVLVPWAEIAPEFRIPGLDATVANLRDRLPLTELEGIQRFSDAPK